MKLILKISSDLPKYAWKFYRCVNYLNPCTHIENYWGNKNKNAPNHFEIIFFENFRKSLVSAKKACNQRHLALCGFLGNLGQIPTVLEKKAPFNALRVSPSFFNFYKNNLANTRLYQSDCGFSHSIYTNISRLNPTKKQDSDSI